MVVEAHEHTLPPPPPRKLIYKLHLFKEFFSPGSDDHIGPESSIVVGHLLPYS